MRAQIQIAGNLGSEPELKSVGDSNVCSFSVAVNRKVKGEKVTDWFNVSVWGKTGEACAKYLAKGKQVVVAGALEPRAYTTTGSGEDRVSLDVRANEVHFLSSRSDDRPPRDDAADAAIAASQDAEQAEKDAQDEDIPF
jgi:single-strand DNA-binding protein